jgi:hypothetical protein
MSEYEVQFQSGNKLKIDDERTLEKIGNAFVEGGRLVTKGVTGAQICLFVGSVEAIFEVGDEAQIASKPRSQRPLSLQKAYEERRKN